MDKNTQFNRELFEEKTITKLRKQFEAKPFRYLIIPDFLTKEAQKKLALALKKEHFHEKSSDLFQFKQTDDMIGTKNKDIAAFRTALSSTEFVAYMKKITGIQLKPNVIDLAGTLYTDTDYLLCHDDQLEGRKIAFLYYLSTLEEKDGGSLNLFSEKNGKPSVVSKKIYPKENTFVIFEVSSISFHEVEEVVSDSERWTLGGWFHG